MLSQLYALAERFWDQEITADQRPDHDPCDQTDPAIREALILDIATRHFLVGTLDTRNRRACTRLDFHDVAVRARRAALGQTRKAGRIVGAKARLAACPPPERVEP